MGVVNDRKQLTHVFDPWRSGNTRPIPPSANPNRVDPVIPVEEFIYCRPVLTGGEIGATECQPTEHKMPPPKVRKVLPKSCPIPAANP